MTIQQAINNFQSLINGSIISGGNKGKQAMIRSSRPILNIHEAVKDQLISAGAIRANIRPPVGARSPELKLAGFLKKKDQDICVIPNNIPPKQETLKDGLLDGQIDPYGKDFTEKTIVVNVRSQISSIQKNFDTLYERTISEAYNLHERCPKMVLGEVYMIAAPEYDSTMFEQKKAGFVNLSQDVIEKYIKSFQMINGRPDITKKLYAYEAVCLLIVDFSRKIPKLYNSTKELINDGLLSNTTMVKYEGLEWESFSSKLINIYNKRF